MANPRKLIASAAVAGGLLVGGVAGFVLGVPGVSGAQTTTVPNAPNATSPNNGAPAPGPANRDGHNCPHMNGSDGTAPGNSAPNGSGTGTGTGTNLGFRHRGGAGGRV